MLNQLLEARRYTFKPFRHPYHPEGVGDSGRLQLATMKADPTVQYIVKNGFPELGCNEYMYHKIASALGMYTQEVRLFRDEQYQHAAAICYVPNAREYHHYTSTNAEHRSAYYSFEALFLILNEDDSHEYFLDDNDRLFKLDNASSFKLNLSVWLAPGGVTLRGAYETEAEKYEPWLVGFVKDHGQEASEPFLETFRRFAALDLDDFLDDLDLIENNYSLDIAQYFYAFIEQRIKACAEFVQSAAQK
jgi:hypothetical protein